EPVGHDVVRTEELGGDVDPVSGKTARRDRYRLVRFDQRAEEGARTDGPVLAREQRVLEAGDLVVEDAAARALDAGLRRQPRSRSERQIQACGESRPRRLEGC